MKKQKWIPFLLLSSSIMTVSLPSSSYSSSTSTASNVMQAEVYHTSIASPEFISGQLTPASHEKAEKIVFQYINENRDKYKLGSNKAEASFIMKKKETNDNGNTIVRFQQMYHSIPVWGSTQVAHITKEGILTVLSGTVIPDLDTKLKNKSIQIQSGEAKEIAEKQLGFTPRYDVPPTVELVIYATDTQATYAYHVHAGFLSPKPESHDYFIDATTGEIVDKMEILHTLQDSETPTKGTGKSSLGETLPLDLIQSNSLYYFVDKTRGEGIYTYDAENQGDEDDTSTLPGTLIENKTNQFFDTNKQAAVDAHVYTGKVYDYYKNILQRNSYDNKGAKLISTVHFGENFTNAFWSSELKEMVYGDGDGSTRPFTAAIDVIGHELTHAVTETTSNLAYKGESGALNEAISDIFGTLIENYSGKDTNYLLGQDLFFTPGKAIRSMKDPTRFGDPDHYSKRYKGTNQSKFVHTNSGIINKAAYLIAEGGIHYGVNVSGIGKEKMGRIFYTANTQYLTETATFSQAKQSVKQAAADLYGKQSQEVQTVSKAFDAVGIQ
ncbi:M4 family metallopeptidase [Bacillus thuringiensis]|uniref:M4 family metallopeptidase n=1 Tax=Bacillus thuringiensis TaxID=1428 RepID=UPI0025A546E6|nr:M4 family metallopeptidase [Bacillus thuringiensis]MDM8365776.1 M4 family metallopeptidase [Bacillus thuringiensis]